MNQPFDFSTFPQLETERLLLREVTRADRDAVFAIFGDPVTSRYLDDYTLKEPDEALKIIDWIAEIFQNKRGLRWGITLKGGDGALIGTCGYNTWYQPNAQGEPGYEGIKADIGYDLNRAYWRQGIMTEALSEMLRFGFLRMALNRVEAYIEPGNAASEATLKKLGFQYEGLLRQSGYWRGAYQDGQLFSLLREESDLA